MRDEELKARFAMAKESLHNLGSVGVLRSRKMNIELHLRILRYYI